MKFSRLRNMVTVSVASMLVLTTSCSDILEPKVYSELTPETFFQSEGDFNQALVAIYSPFNIDWDGIYNADPVRYFGQNMLTTGQLHSQWHDEVQQFTWGPSTGAVAATWNHTIRNVSRATDIIHQLETSDVAMPDELKNRYIAEARTLRAWFNYLLYDYYGPVPVRMNPEELYQLEPDPRPSETAFQNYIIEDLKMAIPHLESNYHNNMSEWGRVSKGTARMLLLRTYLMIHDWPEAEQVARDIMAMGIYELQENYYDVFNNRANTEIIHAIPGTAAAPNWWMPEVLTGSFDRTVDGAPIEFNPNFTGWTVYWMPWRVYDTFDPEDERLDGILDEYLHMNGSVVDREGSEGRVMQGAIPLKYTDIVNPDTQGQPIDFPVFRYAEVLLSLAEVINEQNGGPTTEAEQLLNQVRERVGLEPLTGLNMDDFRDALYLEREHEFHGEAMSRTDQIRFGKFIDNAQDRGLNAEPHHVRFPIPLWVITESEGVVEQNPGYVN